MKYVIFNISCYSTCMLSCMTCYFRWTKLHVVQQDMLFFNISCYSTCMLVLTCPAIFRWIHPMIWMLQTSTQYFSDCCTKYCTHCNRGKFILHVIACFFILLVTQFLHFIFAEENCEFWPKDSILNYCNTIAIVWCNY